ncbi:MAG: hypothetical protein RL701_6048 [Pseudomonadota bacterium]
MNQKPELMRVSGLCRFAFALPIASVLCAVFVGMSATPAFADTPDAKRGTCVLEFHFTPASNAQIALWLEDANGTFLSTVALTEAVATRGIGNRPGASQMNSGFRWPYGRREGVLPIWAHRRLTAAGARPFKRVIFQNRESEGDASRTGAADDYSRDSYFCLSFNNSASKKDALDAVSCASVFSSDKGRFITEADVRTGYSEPYEDIATQVGRMQPLALDSLYPPRRDVAPCASKTCYDSPEAATYDAHVREVMPEIDSVSMATPKGGESQQRLFTVPESWADGSYRACVEVNVEGDYNAAYDAARYRTPTTPAGSWDSWAVGFGYPYRGQPSVVYCVPFELQHVAEATYTAKFAEGTAGSWDTAANSYGQLLDMAGMSDDPTHAPGSGADRLYADATGQRFSVMVKPPISCESNTAPGAIEELALKRYHDDLQAHEWAELDFRAAADDRGVFRYDVRVSTDPIFDEATFMRGQPAKSATAAAEELRIPATAKAGTPIVAELGGLIAETHYFVGVRAVDACAKAGPVAVAEITTPARLFQTVTPCFVATAAYGTPLAQEISVLRRFRDRHLANNVMGRGFVSAYYRVGPKLATFIREREALRSLTRVLLAPAVALAHQLDD